jgi:dienelactone hydrolase
VAFAADAGVLPDPLVATDGTPVKTAEAWRAQRRPELLELFRTQVYGRMPVGRPADLAFAVSATPDMMDGLATRKQVAITFSGPGGKGTINLLLFVPTKREKPAPAFLFICNREATNLDPTRATKSAFWPAEEIVARGYTAAAIQVADMDPDWNDGFRNGVHGIFDQGRTAESWGALAAWAWGASRAMDNLATDPDIDAKRIAVIGHSRGGKAALWAGAEDERFAMVVSNESGCGGAALARGTTGETVAVINQKFPHWFCANYKQYAGKEDTMPVDQHELLALIAPRPLCVGSAAEDANSDPAAEFRGTAAADPVYALFGLTGLGTATMPKLDAPVQEGTISYHVRTGKHDLTVYDWQRYMDFADGRMK